MSTLAVFDHHADEMWWFASLLAPRTAEAERLVIHAVLDPTSHRGRSGRGRRARRLTASVLGAWRGYAFAVGAVGALAVVSAPRESHGGTTTDALAAVATLPDLERAALALCTVGHRTYREAARVLGVTAAEMADVLGRAMRSTTAALTD